MLWVLQSDLYREAGYARLLDVLDRLGIEKFIVKTVPFTSRLLPFDTDTSTSATDIDSIPEPTFDTSKPVMVSGSYTLAKIAVQRGWRPGAFVSPNLEYHMWSNAWRQELLLNPNARICRVEDADFDEKVVFIRPNADSKAFSGRVFFKKEFQSWRKKLIKMSTEDPLNGKTEIIISAPKEIYSEFRLFVIDNKIITASQYKLGARVITSDVVDQDIIDFGKKCIADWVPDRAFVLDVARTPEGCKIVEVNCINAAGFYAADMQKYVMAFETMEF
jgi:hypothetical protein